MEPKRNTSVGKVAAWVTVVGLTCGLVGLALCAVGGAADHAAADAREKADVARLRREHERLKDLAANKLAALQRASEEYGATYKGPSVAALTASLGGDIEGKPVPPAYRRSEQDQAAADAAVAKSRRLKTELRRLEGVIRVSGERLAASEAAAQGSARDREHAATELRMFLTNLPLAPEVKPEL